MEEYFSSFIFVSRAISSRVDLSRNNTIFDYQIPHSQFLETVSARQTERPPQKTMVTSQSKVKKESDESNKRATYQFRLLQHIQ